MQPGQILTNDLQSDIYGGRYELLKDLGRGRWLVRNLPPSEEEIDRIIEDYAEGEANGRGYFATVEGLMEEVERREADAGREYEVQFVSSERWAAMF